MTALNYHKNSLNQMAYVLVFTFLSECCSCYEIITQFLLKGGTEVKYSHIIFLVIKHPDSYLTTETTSIIWFP